MTRTSQLLVRTPLTRVTLNKLAVYLKWFRVARLVFFGLAAIVFVQLLYPREVTRPFARMDSTKLGLKTASSIKKQLTAADNLPRKVKVGQKAYQLSLASAGIRSDAAATASQAVDYSLKERLVPFSVFKKTAAEQIRGVDTAKLDQVVDQLVNQNAKAANNPSVVLAPSGFVVKPGNEGVAFDKAKLKAELINLDTKKQSLEYSGEVVKLTVDEHKLQTAVAAANQQAGRQLTLNIQGKTYLVDASTIRNWTKINIDQNSGAISTTYDLSAIKAWLSANTQAVIKPAVATQTLVIDDAVAQNQPGQAGIVVDQTKTAAAINQALTAKTDKAEGAVAATPVPVQVTRKYSPTSRGLQLIINKWSKAHPGMSAGVVFKEVGGQGRQAALNADRRFFPASIYKLFTTLFLVTQIGQGQIDPNSQILPGKTIAGCMYAMIVVSDNACPSAVGSTYGWSNIGALARARGFGATTLSGTLATTASDVANYLTGLVNGSLMPANDSAVLLDRMQRQVYRSAIPAGSPGCTVADKVGFVDNYWHDAAVVSCPKVKYVLVVFTQNGSPKAIKDLALQVNNLIK